ncbi:MAG: hypothetical protein K0R69_391 [Clostridia bacterium]|nr:hypothetical protein [Clostridia bacterium]
MIIVLCIMEIILAALIVLTHYMIINKFKSIELSLNKYGNSRVYKVQAQIAFIEKVIHKYKESKQNLEDPAELENIIRTILYREYIGRFPFLTIKNIATKTTQIMWGIIFLEALIAFVNKTADHPSTIVIITASMLITIAVQMFKFIKGIEEEGEMTMMIVHDYVRHIYPVEAQRKLTNKDIIQLKTKVSELEKEIKAEEEIKPLMMTELEKQKRLNDELSEQDIARLIRIFQ